MERIEAQFSLLDEGRTYTGHHRNYIIEAAKKVASSPVTLEKIKLREAVGYFGHGRRNLAGKMKLPEFGTIKGADGRMIAVENIPACVTVSLDVDNNGNVRHVQDVLDTEPGRIVSALNASKVGGFSWACGGIDTPSATVLDSFHGMDYVIDPGFSANRGYILESADALGELGELLARAGLTGDQIAAWALSIRTAPIFEAAELRDRLAASDSIIDAMRARIEELEPIRERETRRRSLITESAARSVVVVPPNVREALIGLNTDNDIDVINQFFENAHRVDVSSLPIFESTAPMIDKKALNEKTVGTARLKDVGIGGDRGQLPYDINFESDPVFIGGK